MYVPWSFHGCMKANTRIYCDAAVFGAFAKLQKSTITFIMSVGRPVRPSAWNNLAPSGRISIKFDICAFFPKYFEKIQVSLKSDKSNGYFTWRPIYIFDHLAFFLECEMFSDNIFRENQNTFLCSVTLLFFYFFKKCCRLWDNVDKHCRAGQATDGNMAHAYCTLNT